MTEWTAQAEKIIARCRELASFSEVAGETTRTFLSEPMRHVHQRVAEWMEAAGMRVSVDAIGNIRGLLGPDDGARLVIASHLDTVPNAGAFDGVLGVMLGIAVAELFSRQDASLPCSIEVIGFSEEEGVRFRRPFFGSMAVTGTLDEAALALTDAAGVTVAQAIHAFGIDPTRMAEARLAETVFGYLEFHIEQGPVLEAMGRSLGVVSALVGQTRLELTFTGYANHAGTTPMDLRHDALAAAAEWMVAVEKAAQECAGLVATVGRVEVSPGAGNVIPGRVLAALDVRHELDEIRRGRVAEMLHAATHTAKRRGVHVSSRTLMEQTAVALDAELTARLQTAVGSAALRMTSGAGHDAMMVAPHVPSAMLFLRSPGGISHHPDETVLVEDVAAALDAGVRFVNGFGTGA